MSHKRGGSTEKLAHRPLKKKKRKDLKTFRAYPE